MKKEIKSKIVLVYFSLFFITLAFYASIYFLQNYYFKYKYDGLTKKVLTTEEFKNYTYDYVRCNLNIFNPEIVVISSYYDPILTFHTIPIFPIYDIQSPLDYYTGSTRIYNLPFPQALQMLKKDCKQFKRSKDVDINRIDSEMYWEYTPYTKESEDESYQRYWQEIEKEEKETIRKIESGEIKVKSTYEQLKELGFSEQEIQELMQEMRDKGLKIYK